MARLAGGSRQDVVRRLAGRGRAVMAAGAARRDAGVVEGSSGERHGVLVTCFTRRLRLDV